MLFLYLLIALTAVAAAIFATPLRRKVWTALALTAAGALWCSARAVGVLAGADSGPVWSIPGTLFGGDTGSMDGLSALFVVIISVGAVAAVLYSRGYLAHCLAEKSPAHISLHYTALVAMFYAMLGVVLSDGGFSFLFFWELMTVASFLLILFDAQRREVRRAALSYLIQNADKPIILTGAQQPISNEITDAKKNLRDSVVCAIDPGSRGVMVVFGGHVIAGTRAKKNKTISYDAFASVNFPELALVQGDRLVRYIPSPWPTGPVEFSRVLDPKVFLLKLTPGMSPALIPEIFHLYDCVIVESFGVGGIPQQLMDAFAAGLGDYETTHKVLIMTTQVTYEGSDVGVYEVGKRVKNRFRFLEAHDMTIEAVVTKSMWLLAQNCESFDQLQQRFYRQVNFDTFYH